MKGFIKKLLREGLLNESNGVFKDTTGIPDYEQLKKGNYDELPDKYREMEAKIEYMTPEEYLRACAEQQGTTYEKQLSFIRKDKVEELKILIDDGTQLYMPYLNNVKGDVSQEGRHRAKAAMDMGINKIPVLVIDSIESSESNDMLSSKIGVWDDLSKDEIGNFYVSYDLSSDWKVHDVLLSSISKSYDTYYLDDLLSKNMHPTLYPNLLKFVNMDNFISLIKFKISDVIDFSDKLPDEYADLFKSYHNAETDEEEKQAEEEISKLIKPLEKLVTLYILIHNDSIFRDIFSYDQKTKIGKLKIDDDMELNDDYNSGKDMLSHMMIYDDLGLYGSEGDEYYDIDWKFIEKYIDFV